MSRYVAASGRCPQNMKTLIYLLGRIRSATYGKVKL